MPLLPTFPDRVCLVEEKRIFALFIPQYINDADGDIYKYPREQWITVDVTDAVVALGKKKALLVEDDQCSSDELIPEWIISSNNGPFAVEVEHAIREYFKK